MLSQTQPGAKSLQPISWDGSGAVCSLPLEDNARKASVKPLVLLAEDWMKIDAQLLKHRLASAVFEPRAIQLVLPAGTP